MTSIKNIFLILASVAFLVVIGGGAYEHVAVVPQWAAAPPRSLSMFQGRYGLNAGAFWKSIHPITILLFIGALAANWKTNRRKFIAWPFAAYFSVLIITAIYFVPELMQITSTAYQDTVDPLLKSRADRWEMLSLFRLFVMMLLAGVLLYALPKPADSVVKQ